MLILCTSERVADTLWGHVAYIHLREGEKAEKVGGVGIEQPDRGSQLESEALI